MKRSTPLDLSAMRFTRNAFLALLLALTLPLASGCDGFLDVNDDPNSATDVAPAPLFVTATAAMGANRTIELVATTFHAQTWASDGGAGVFNEPQQYIISPFSTGNTWSSKYITQNENLQLLINNELDEENPDYNAILQARTLQAQNYHDLTVLFGPIPFTEANNLNVDLPNFDDQETVLLGIDTLLATAIDQASPGSNSTDLPGISQGDLIYGGDINQWVRYANSLRLKSLMLARAGGSNVDSQIQSLIDDDDLIEVNEDNALIPFSEGAGNENPRFQLLDDFAGGNVAFFHAGEELVSLMTDLNDPRLPTYFSETNAGGYEGAPPGVFGGDYSAPSDNILRPAYPARLVTAGEILLLQAEFLASNDDDDASDAYEAGIRASMDFFDERPGSVPEESEDAYIDALDDLDSMDDDDAVVAIQQQQYIDVFERSIDAWTTQRRTNVPDLETPQGAILGDIIERYSYPPDVQSANPNTPTPVPATRPLYFSQ